MTLGSPRALCPRSGGPLPPNTYSPRSYFMFSPTESPMMRATVPSKSTATATKISSFWGNRGESGGW